MRAHEDSAGRSGRAVRVLLVVAGLGAAPAHAQPAEPLRIRNLNPLVAIFGLPAWDTVAPGNRLEATLEVANHYRLSQRGGALLILDGETVRTSLAFSHGFSSGWSLGVEVPYYRVGGGVLDDVIDDWHSTFNLPDGGRNNRPEDQFLFRMADSNGTFFDLARPQAGLGDVQLKAARRFGTEQEFVVELGLKLATGEEAMLAGSGRRDGWGTLLRARALTWRDRPAGYYWGVGVVRLGDPPLIDFRSERWIYTALLGGSWQPWPRFGLKVQLDTHGAAYKSQLEEIGADAIEATIAAWRDVGRRGSLEFAVVEDLAVSTAPDVVIQVAAKWRR
jgi:Protein of unknown function (DUF3187)